MSDTFTFDSISSAAFGLYVFPTDSMLSAPARKFTRLIVPGRSGALLIDEKSFDNTTREYGVIMTGNAARQNLAGLRAALASRSGYFRLTDTFDADHYFMAMYAEPYEPELEWRSKDAAKAVITFERKPQRYLTSGETAVAFTATGTITNPTRFDVQPLLRVYGVGVLGIGSVNITLTNYDMTYIDIDCATGRAFNGATALDNYVTLNAIDFPVLKPGSNGVSLGTGITRVEITPRWWEV